MVIDATGKYVMPGIVNTHMHWHEERVGSAADSVRAQSVPRGRRDDGARGRRRLRRRRSSGGRERRAHDHRAAHPRLPDVVDASGTAPDRRPRSARWSATQGAGADGLKIIGPMDRDQVEATHRRGEEARAADDRAHRGRARRRRGTYVDARRQLHRALLRRRRRGARRHPGLPAGDELLERDPPLRPRRRAVHAGELDPAKLSQAPRPHGREARRAGARRCRSTRRAAT